MGGTLLRPPGYGGQAANGTAFTAAGHDSGPRPEPHPGQGGRSPAREIAEACPERAERVEGTQRGEGHCGFGIADCGFKGGRQPGVLLTLDLGLWTLDFGPWTAFKRVAGKACGWNNEGRRDVGTKGRSDPSIPARRDSGRPSFNPEALDEEHGRGAAFKKCRRPEGLL
jgi:hypothetical protein